VASLGLWQRRAPARWKLNPGERTLLPVLLYRPDYSVGFSPSVEEVAAEIDLLLQDTQNPDLYKSGPRRAEVRFAVRLSVIEAVFHSSVQ
jgi:hypothetical protein